MDLMTAGLIGIVLAAVIPFLIKVGTMAQRRREDRRYFGDVFGFDVSRISETETQYAPEYIEVVETILTSLAKEVQKSFRLERELLRSRSRFSNPAAFVRGEELEHIQKYIRIQKMAFWKAHRVAKRFQCPTKETIGAYTGEGDSYPIDC